MSKEQIIQLAVAGVIILWTLPWKGVALWKSAKNGDLKWFIALLIVNTVGILEIIYILFFSKKASDKKEFDKKEMENQPPRIV